MDPNKLNAEGARMLKRYLEYADSSGASLGNMVMEKPPLNPFEIDVRDQLTAAGIPVVPQYGCSGYWIDYAAEHPTKPGEMVLAIECDGATYHSAQTARDRDRLRQQHLERLGWRFHRIWSFDWFRSREAEVARAKAAYDAAVSAADAEQTATPATPVLPSTTSAVSTRGPRPRVRSGLPITDYSMADLIAMVRWIESDTLLRTEEETLTELMSELGFKRRGPRIVEVLTVAIKAADHQQ
jgi:very-short-patch-repair endonuclease